MCINKFAEIIFEHCSKGENIFTTKKITNYGSILSTIRIELSECKLFVKTDKIRIRTIHNLSTHWFCTLLASCTHSGGPATRAFANR